MAIGMLASASFRWQGCSSSWLVLERKTELSLSKLSLPSGFGYSMRWDWAAGFRQA
ncbi:hypothetical protein D3C72_1877550 [compost metagenome]